MKYWSTPFPKTPNSIFHYSPCNFSRQSVSKRIKEIGGSGKSLWIRHFLLVFIVHTFHAFTPHDEKEFLESNHGGLIFSMRKFATTASVITALLIIAFFPAEGRAQAALLMEEPYGFFGSINPTGHNAIYFRNICAETPINLRRCHAGEQGAVLSRYQGIDGVDWVAIPLIPYLYSVENASQVPAHIDHETVHRLRDRYREAHLLGLGDDLSAGNLVRGGWTQLVGVSYERRIYAFRFETTAAEDDTFIARMNDSRNRSHFHLLFNNCSDFARVVLNFYFPRAFRRSIFPDAGMTTPKQLAYKLERSTGTHPQAQLAIYEIPQIPGYRRQSRSNKSVAESLATTVYAIPIALANPYLAGGIFVDYLVRGRHHLIPAHPALLEPGDLSPLTALASGVQNSLSAGLQVPSAAVGGPAHSHTSESANSGLAEIKVTHE
jgi:cbb3-type cytochrome oxidase subunit 3